MARGIRRLAPGGRRNRLQAGGPEGLRRLLDSLPEALRRQALSHSSWVAHRAESYGRLAFLGDAVLGLAISEHLFRDHPRSDIGRLTKVHGQAVSGRACVEVAEAMDLPALIREVAPDELEGGIDAESLLASERALASICEAVIGACYLHHGFEPTTEATVAAFEAQIAIASETLLDFKSALQELLAREGSKVRYDVAGQSGPPHDRVFEVVAQVDGEVVGRGTGRSKKSAEQAAAEAALERLRE